MVNPKTIDSISAQVIPKADKMQQPAPIVLDAEYDAGKQQISRTQPSIMYRKCKKETVIDAVDKRVGIMI